MKNEQADRKPSDAPKYVTNKLRSRGNTLMELPEAALLVGLLEPTNPQARTLHADGTLNYNVTYLALTPRSQARRKKLVTNISKLLGNKMDDWHEALHRPHGLPANALDWSTVLLQQTLDLAKSVPGNILYGVHQAMTDKNTSLVKAALHLRTVEPISARDIEIYLLGDIVQRLQEEVDDDNDLAVAMLELKLETQNLRDEIARESNLRAESEAREDVSRQQKIRLLRYIRRLDQESNSNHNMYCIDTANLQDELTRNKTALNDALILIEHLKVTVWEDVDITTPAPVRAPTSRG
jgi:hypothetical protein